LKTTSGLLPATSFAIVASTGDIYATENTDKLGLAGISRYEGRRRWDPKRSYLFYLNAYWQIDGAIGGSGAEYINHSCEPNLRTRIVRGHILYFSKRSIQRGEELTVDYRYDADITRMPCHCGAPTCRGTMNVPRTSRSRRAATANRR